MALAGYCALYFGLVAAAMALIARRRGAGWACLAAPILWVAGEWLRATLLGGFPWGELGYSQYRQLTVLQALRALSAQSGVPLLVGTVDVTESGRQRNTAFLLTGQGIIGRYDKIHLVPFGEFVPLSGIIGFVKGWAEFISELEPGARATVFPGPPAPFGVVICYEGIFPELFRRFVRNGARVMVNMTNDAWFGHTEGPLQHLAMYPLRAVEHRTAVVRVANTGVSAFITPKGRIATSLGLFERGDLVGQATLRSRVTLYTRAGEWLAYAALVLSGGALVATATGKAA